MKSPAKKAKPTPKPTGKQKDKRVKKTITTTPKPKENPVTPKPTVPGKRFLSESRKYNRNGKL